MIGTTAALIAAGIGAAGSVAGGAMAASGAKGAAKTQAEAAGQVGQSARETANEVASGVFNESQRAADGVDAATQFAIGRVGEGSDLANNHLTTAYRHAGEVTDPYRVNGANAINQLSGIAQEQFQYDPNLDPGTQARLRMSQQALERSAAARGSLLTGGALKSLDRLSQDYASNEYSKAFDRFQQDRAARAGILSGVAGLGSTANSQYLAAGQNWGNQGAQNIMNSRQTEGAFGMQGATAAGGFRVGGAESAGNTRMQGESIFGNAMTGAANANAAGQVGAANAWSGAINNSANNASQMVLLSQLMKKTPGGVNG